MRSAPPLPKGLSTSMLISQSPVESRLTRASYCSEKSGELSAVAQPSYSSFSFLASNTTLASGTTSPVAALRTRTENCTNPAARLVLTGITRTSCGPAVTRTSRLGSSWARTESIGQAAAQVTIPSEKAANSAQNNLRFKSVAANSLQFYPTTVRVVAWNGIRVGGANAAP